MIYYKDKKYNFVECFNETTGTMVRSNVLNSEGETNEYPTMRSFPELIDIGIMGTCDSAEKGLCVEAGIDCYQSASLCAKPNMNLENYLNIMDQCKGRTFQVALGGAGNPNKHERFEEILDATRKNRIIPNVTTSGHNLTDSEIALIKKYCGAVAVSFYTRLDDGGNETNPITLSTVDRFVEAGCVTNIHYVLSKENICEAAHRLKNNLFPMGINAVIFLLYKPVGLGKKSKVLTYDDLEYTELLKSITSYGNRLKIGFDSCQSPAVLKFSKNVAMESIQFCDATRFSMYIDSTMKAYPCSFGITSNEYTVDLNNCTITEAWDSREFKNFRSKQKTICCHCQHSSQCRNCAFDLDINVCGELVL